MADFNVESLTIEVRMDTGDFLAGVERVTAALDGLSRVVSGFVRDFVDGMGTAEKAAAELGWKAASEAGAIAEAMDGMAQRLVNVSGVTVAFSQDVAEGMEKAGEAVSGLGETVTSFIQGLMEGFGEAEDEMADAGEAATGEAGSLVDAIRELNAHLAALEGAAGRPFNRMGEEADKAKKKTKEVDSEVTKLGKSLGSRIKSVVTGFAAPMLASLALGGLAKNWLSTVGEAAEKTGAVNVKLEEERRKREALSRVTREDIELYRKGREALARFQMMMDRLSATVMRAFGPALGWLVERFNAITDWVGRNEHNITRFFKALALTMTTLLIPATIKWGAAWLANPITWIVGALMLLALVIDDLMTWMEGGESLLGDFWARFGTGAEISEKLGRAWKKLVEWGGILLDCFLAIARGVANNFGDAFNSALNVLDDFFTMLDGILHGDFEKATQAAANLLTNLSTLAKDIFVGIVGFVWDAIISALDGLFPGFKEGFEKLKNWVLGGIKDLVKKFSWMLPDAVVRWANEDDGEKKPQEGQPTGSPPSAPTGAFAALPPDAPAGAYGVALGEEFDRMQASLNETYAPVTNNNQRTVTIGDVTVNTASTDPAAAAREIMKVGNLFGGTAAAEGGIR